MVEHHNAEKLIEPQEFIGLEEISLGVASRLGIGAGGTVDGGKQRCQGKLIVGDGDRDLSLLSPFECLCGNFILPEPASYVFFYAIFNLRKLLYIIRYYCLMHVYAR